TVSSATVAVDETDTAITTAGTLTSTDVDSPDNTFTPSTTSGTNGDFAIDANGHWTFTANRAFNSLNVGDKVEETFTVSSVDGTQSTVKVTINGTNDLPVISGTTTGDVIEAGASTVGSPTATGNLVATDPDTGDTLTWAVAQGQGTYGDLTVDQHGQWHYQLNNSNPATDALSEGQKAQEIFTVTATDSSGNAVQQTITVGVSGTNDKPVISAWTQLTDGLEDKSVTITASDLLTHATDVDSGDVLTVTNLQANHGSLVDNHNGTYTFTPDKDYNGEVHLTYSVQDGHGGSTNTQARFNLAASPDNAVITDAQPDLDVRGVTEDRGYIDTHYMLHYDGKLNIQDPDAGEAQFDPNIGPQTYMGIGYDTKMGGHVVLSQDGTYTYTLDNRNIQGLAAGDTKQDSVVIHSVDGTTYTMKFTVHGTNDTPTISAQSHSVTEGGALMQGQMQGQDIDTGAVLTYTTPSVDGLIFNSDGSYSFDPSHATYQSIPSGVTKTLTIPVTVTDEHHASSTQPLTITITGANNAAVVGGVDTGDVSEQTSGVDMSPNYAQPGMAILSHTTIGAHGQLTIIDPDSGESVFETHGQGYEYAGKYGDLHLTESGHWDYYADTGRIRTVGGALSSRGTEIDKLGEGETLIDTVTVSTKDGTTHDIVITIHGDNDRPYCLSEVQLNSGKEDTAQTITVAELLKNTVDVDANDAGRLGIANLHADHGSIATNADGSFTFTPDPDYYGQVHFTYDVKDAHGGATATGATMQLQGVADAAQISGQHTGDITEDKLDQYHTQLELQGQLHVIDPDGGEARFISVTKIDDPYNLNHNGLIISDSGSWYFSVNNSLVQGMAEGETKDIVYEVSTVDGTKQRITITLHGTNDNPELIFSGYGNLSGGPHPITTDEDKAVSIPIERFMWVGKDIDHGDTLHIEQLHVDHGTAVVSPDGKSVIYTPEKDFNGQATFTYAVMDNHGAQALDPNTGKAGISGMMLTVNAVGDAAVIQGVDTGSVTEKTAGDNMSPDHAHSGMATLGNSVLYADGQLTVIDPDTGEQGFPPHTNAYNYHGTYGDLILNTDGSWHYVADAGSVSHIGGRPTTRGTAIDQLGDGETLTDTITVHSIDGTPHDIVITIHGSNDRPYCSSEVQLNAGTEDTRQTITVAQLLQNTVDVDNNDVGLLTIENLHPDHGSIAVNPDGSFSFTPEKDYNGDVHFTYDVKDNHGGITHTGATTTLAAVNDSPDNVPVIDSLTEDTDTHHAVNLLAGATDVDGDTLSISQIQASFEGSSGGLPQGVTIAKDGHSLIIDSHAKIFQHLSAGEKADIVVHYMIDDNHGGQTSATATITMVGADDKATLASNVIQMTETQALDSAQHGYGGKLQLVDPDTGDNTQFVFSGQYLGQGYAPGAFEIWPDGSYQFRLQGALNRHADDLVGGLHSGESIDFPYEIKTSDGQTLTVMVRVTGEDSNAHINVPLPNLLSASQTVTEDHFVNASPTHLYAGGRLQVVDPDHDQSYLQAEVINTAHQGHFNISADGGWNYTIDNSLDEVQKLGAGESFTETHTVHSLDGTASQLLTVTVQGTNDAPIVSAQVQLAPGSEDTDIQLSKADLLANATDIDHNDIGQLDVANLVADHGKIVDNQDGTFTFHPDANYNGQVNFSYDVTDAHGGITHTGANTTLTAVNDASSLASQFSSATVTEDNISRPASHELASPWTNLDTIDVDSSAEANIVQIEVNGVIHQVPADFALSLQGSHGSFVTTHSTDGHNKWRYVADNNHSEIQGLKDGQSLTDSMTLITADGTRIPITATIRGTDDHVIIDTPAATTATQGTAVEDSKTTISGTLQAHDLDTDDTVHFEAQNSVGAYGTLSVNRDGSWHYDLDPSKANQLRGSDNKAEGFDVVAISSDGSKATQHIQVNVQGTEDAAIITGDDKDSITEDQNVGHSSAHPVAVSGTLSVTDPDAGQDHFQWSQLGEKAIHDPFHGQLHITAQGNWGYEVANSALQYLHEGDVEHVVYQVRSADGTTHDITITVHGTNDAPLLTAQTHSVTEDGMSLKGQMQATDQDYNTHLSYGIANQVDGLTFNADGSYTFDPSHSSYQHLGAGQDQTITIPVTVTDEQNASSTENLTIVVHGTDDLAKVTVADLDITETEAIGSGYIGAHHQAVRGNFQISDIDSSNSHFDFDVYHGSHDYGALTVWQDGSYEFKLNSASQNHRYQKLVESLKPGETLTDTFNVTTSDGQVLPVKITINGEQDTAIIVDAMPQSSPSTQSVQEDHNITFYPNMLHAGGRLDVLDHDHGESGLQTQDITTAHGGVFHIQQDGHWDYQIDNRGGIVQSLGAGESFEEKIVVSSLDGSGTHTLTVTVFGTNDQPTLAVQQSTPTTGKLTETDVDTQDTHSFSVVTSHGQFGDLTVDPDSGAYSYTPNGTVAGMSYNTATKTYHGLDVFEVKVADNHGGEASKFITFDANGQVTASTGNQPTISTTVPNVPTITTSQPSMPSGSNVAPTNSVTVDLTAASDSGISHSDDVTNDNTPTISGTTAIPFSKVTLYDGSTAVGHAISDANGDYSASLSTLSDGSHHISAKALAPASVTPAVSSVLDIKIDTDASITVNPIASDNIVDATEKNHSLTISGSVNGVEDGQFVTVTIAGQHHQAQVQHGAWSTQLSSADVQALHGGVNDVSASVSDNAGNHVSTNSPLFVEDSSNQVPMLGFKTPPQPTGGGGLGSHMTGVLVAPPLLQQLNPQLGSGWGISDGHGHSVLSLHGQYGTLTIDPHTGKVDYVYSQAPTAGQKTQGGTHWVGSTTSEEHHDVFQVLYHDVHSSNVDVKVNLDITYIHGHSGHNTVSTHMVGMDVTPAISHPAPPPPPPTGVAYDEPGFDSGVEDSPTITLESLASDAHEHQSGAQHYLAQLGIEKGDSSESVDQAAPSDMDLILAQADHLTGSEAHLDELGNSLVNDEDTSVDEHDKHQHEEPTIDHHFDPNDYMDHS
ncbi:VCBS domain-containing protein, partial [Vibrio inusitatus]